MRICQVGTLESLTSSEIDAPTVDITWREWRGCLARRAVGRRTVRGASDVDFHAARKRLIAMSLLIMAAAATGAETPEAAGPRAAALVTAHARRACFFGGTVLPVGLFLGALLPTLIAAALFQLL
jgi:hypothetical protein